MPHYRVEVRASGVGDTHREVPQLNENMWPPTPAGGHKDSADPPLPGTMMMSLNTRIFNSDLRDLAQLRQPTSQPMGVVEDCDSSFPVTCVGVL